MTRTIKAQKLSLEAFNPYGSYLDLKNPVGYPLQGTYHTFYRDPIRYVSNGQEPTCLSSLIVKRNPEFIVTGMEYHDYTDEIQLPVDNDAILVCAPATGGDIKIDEVEAFIIPAGTVLVLKRGTWHDVMYPLSADVVSCLIGLPERIYHNDIVVKSFEEGEIKVEV